MNLSKRMDSLISDLLKLTKLQSSDIPDKDFSQINLKTVANEIKSGVVIYDNNNIPYDNQNERKQIQAEMCKAFIQGSGIVVIKNSLFIKGCFLFKWISFI